MQGQTHARLEFRLSGAPRGTDRIFEADMAELVDALVSGISVQKTWGFDSLYPHHSTRALLGARGE